MSSPRTSASCFRGASRAGPCRLQVINHPAQGLSLVPVDVRSQLDDLAPRSSPEARGAGRPRAPPRPLRRLGRGRRYGSAWRTPNRLCSTTTPGIDPSCSRSSGGRLLEHRYGGRGGVVLVVCSVGCGQLETVAAGIPDAGQADAPGHVGEVTAGQHRDRTTRRQLPQCLGPRPGRAWRYRVIDDVGQRAVEVEEQRRPFGRRVRRSGRAPLTRRAVGPSAGRPCAR